MSYCKKITSEGKKPAIEVIITSEMSNRLEGKAFEHIICNEGNILHAEMHENKEVRIIAEFPNEKKRNAVNKCIWDILFTKETDYDDEDETVD